MLSSEFDYPLPDDAIARVPVEPRDSARLLVDRGDRFDGLVVSDLPSLLGPGDVVVLNDTRVVPARVRFRRSSGGTAEVLLLEETHGGWWEALVRPSARLAPGTVVKVSEALTFEFGADLGEGRRLVHPEVTGSLLDALDRHGEMPLPPYLGDMRIEDPERYQTVFANRPASAAAPTAGLHLTAGTLHAIAVAGAAVVQIELVVGLGTFRPIMTADVEDHVMHRERYRVSAEAWQTIEAAERVVAVGTTSVRALESVAASGSLVGATELFIRRGHPWQVVDAVMTNFHQPRSSLLVMIDAFIGPRWRALYEHALADDYRFLSFGDAMFLERAVQSEMEGDR